MKHVVPHIKSWRYPNVYKRASLRHDNNLFCLKKLLKIQDHTQRAFHSYEVRILRTWAVPYHHRDRRVKFSSENLSLFRKHPGTVDD